MRTSHVRIRLLALTTVAAMLALGQATRVEAQLFVDVESFSPVTKSSNLSGFPNITWANRFAFDVSGAVASPDGTLYLCNGAFTTRLDTSTLIGPPTLRSTLTVDIHALACGRGKLYG